MIVVADSGSKFTTTGQQWSAPRQDQVPEGALALAQNGATASRISLDAVAKF